MGCVPYRREIVAMVQSVRAVETYVDEQIGFPQQLRCDPGWIDGLRQIYSTVVNEPLPPAFESLLKRLDEAEDDRR